MKLKFVLLYYMEETKATDTRCILWETKWFISAESIFNENVNCDNR